MALKIGFARVDITPDVSVPLAGLGNTLNRMSENILDRLQSTCLACSDDNGNTLLLYTSDLICAVPKYLDQARMLIFEKYGIAPECVMFAHTHTHSATDFLQRDHESIIHSSGILIKKLVDVAGEALADRVSANLLSGEAYPNSLNFVRHYTRDPETKELTGHPYDPDNQLQIVMIKREDAKDIMVMNWQAHPCFTSGYDKHDVSADYIHSFREMVEDEYDCLFAFFLGASGDINSRSRIKSEVIAPDRDSYVDCMRKYIQQAFANLRSIDGDRISILRRDVKLVIDHSDDHRIGDAKIVTEFWKKSYDRKATDDMARQYGINSPYHANAIIARSTLPDSQVISVDAVCLGDLGIVFAPYEMFCQNGMYIKSNSPMHTTIVSTCSNNGYSYLADDFAFTEQCYEVDVRRFARGTAEKLAETFVDMLEVMKRD